MLVEGSLAVDFPVFWETRVRLVAAGTVLRHGTRTAPRTDPTERSYPSNEGVQLRGSAPSAATRQLDRSASRAFAKRGKDLRDSFRKIGSHQFRIQPQHPIPQPSKHAVPTLICGAPQRVTPAIDFEVRSTLPRKPTAAAWSIDGIPCLGKSSSYAVS
jgi:hypothetical protein